jgi:integrase
MMSTIVARRGKYQAQVRLARRPAMFRTFPTKRAAERWAREVEAQLAIGADAATVTLAQAIETYLATAAGRKLDGHEVRILTWWSRRLGRKRLSELRRADFYAARDAMRGVRGNDLEPATRNRRVALVAAALTHAMRLDWITHNPARIERLTEDNLVERLLTPAEIERLLRACRGSTEPSLYPMVLVAMSSGARAGELKRLVWRDVDLEAGVAGLLKTKSGRRRPIPIRGAALDELRRIRRSVDDETAPGQHVFVARNGRVPFDYSRAWHAARAATGLLDVRFHDLRHLVASTLAEHGTSTRELMALLGHSNPSTTARYAHLVDRHIVQLGDVLAERLLGKTSTMESHDR